MLIRKLTGIFIRAKIDDQMGTYDIVDLPWEITEEWLTKSEEHNEKFIINVVDILVEKLVDLLTFIGEKSNIDPHDICKNLYGDPIHQCRQCIAFLNMLADVYDLTAYKES
jgi:hypothetical protein